MLGDLWRLVWSWVASTLALMIAAGALPDLSASNPLSYVLVAAVAGVAGYVLRPVLVTVSARIGWLAIVLCALVGQAVIMHLALLAVPGVSATFPAAIAASWISAAAGTLIAWLGTAGTDDGLVATLVRRAPNGEVSGYRTDDPGVIFVQLDGVAFEVLRWATQAGTAPTARRWLTDGDFRLHRWRVQVPCTTPASQLGILHGTVDRIPAFRWYDRELGRIVVSNRPADARLIEARASNGRGLLADGGVSISNLFSGDADRSLLTMSRVELGRGSAQSRQAMAWFLTSPTGFARSLSRTIGEVAKERWQARRQRRRGLEPRVERGWTFAVLRGITNGLLRDLNTALVAQEVRRGTPSMFVDYVDYDEIAHHAGVFRPESLAALDGLDRVLGLLERISRSGPRPYHLVVLSDHGQSQGTPFKDRYDSDLAQLCHQLTNEPVQNIDRPVETVGRAESILDEVGAGGRLAARAEGAINRAQTEGDEHELVVLGSGNLGLLYQRGPQRLTVEEITERWPRLIPGLADHPGIGFVAGQDAAGEPWAIGATGRRNLRSGEVIGRDPLARFGSHAARTLRRAVAAPDAPDLYVNSQIDVDTFDIAAFEDLVGAHGGLGGWQDSGLLMLPTAFDHLVPETIEGADQLHRVLVDILRTCGQRGNLDEAETTDEH